MKQHANKIINAEKAFLTAFDFFKIKYDNVLFNGKFERINW